MFSQKVQEKFYNSKLWNTYITNKNNFYNKIARWVLSKCYPQSWTIFALMDRVPNKKEMQYHLNVWYK